MLYGFNHEESFKSFELAAAKDPASPMPHWGMSLALGTNINDIAPADRLKQAYAHLAEAEKRKSAGSDVEQGLVDALAKRYVADAPGDQMPREQAYSAAMGELSKKFPADDDVGHALCREPDEPPAVAALYEGRHAAAWHRHRSCRRSKRVMARNPEHPGANHYYIHAVEASKRPGSRAAAGGTTRVARARRRTSRPHARAHLHPHRPVREVGEEQRGRRARSTRNTSRTTGANGIYPTMYYTHNLQFESAAAMFAGNLAQARAAAERTVKFADPIADQMAMIEPFAAQDLVVLVRFGQWADILAAKPPAATRLVQTIVYHFAHGAASAGTGKVDAAEADLAGLKAAAAKLPKDLMLGPSNSAAAIADVASADLTARIAEAKGDVAAAMKAYEIAIRAEDNLGYGEPPDWLNPERERLGALQLKAKKYAEAEQTFRADLAKNPGNPRSLYGLYRALEGQRKYASTEAKSSFEKAWAAADVTLADDCTGRGADRIRRIERKLRSP